MNLNHALSTLARDPSAVLDVAEIALWLARDEHPDVDVEAYLGELAALAHDVRPRLCGPLPARIRALSRYLFHELGFRGNTQDYYDPRNSYFNQVLDRRVGIPITLSVVAMAIGERAGLRVFGVGLPGHFIAKAAVDGQEVLFDPFHAGRLLTAKQCEVLAEEVTGVPFAATPDSLAATPLQLIVVRMLTNLKAIYLRQGDFVRAIRVIERIRQVLPSDLSQRRDLGAALLRAGYAGRALPHLEAYLAVASAVETDNLQQLIAKAKTEIARWN